ncbi:YeeE/YedE family protein [Pontibacter harenae]|uniref:YeeE/YedE family protein n=1 Tax=Pontibacter harenae TaxID=2894083 RepID=UPI001E46F2A4|nr:YeeE/YedE thiosulfate transporter family protein [Pontibacter harenae]MCC9169002.1 YeeE/YedE family protein [Pontibacter harenae]
MEQLIEWLSQPWPWNVAGPLITLTMLLLLFVGKSFGVSDTLRTTCAIGGASRVSDFFDFDWRKQTWNIVFVLGAVLGGFIASTWLQQPEPIPLAQDTVLKLQELGINNAGEDYLPVEIFSWESLLTLRGFVVLVLGGFLVGFGARYAGGCTSGHAISGLSNLQLPSLIAVIGFFIGGLVMTYFLLPVILTL